MVPYITPEPVHFKTETWKHTTNAQRHTHTQQSKNNQAHSHIVTAQTVKSLTSSLIIMANPKKLETGLRTLNAGIVDALLLGIEAFGFPTLGLLLYPKA